MDHPDNAKALKQRFGNQPPDIMSELESMLRIYDIDAEELFFKWESFSMRMNVDALTLDSACALKKDVHNTLEKELRAKTKMQQTPALQRTSRPQPVGADPFRM